MFVLMFRPAEVFPLFDNILRLFPVQKLPCRECCINLLIEDFLKTLTKKSYFSSSVNRTDWNLNKKLLFKVQQEPILPNLDDA